MPDTIKKEPKCQFTDHGKKCHRVGFHHYQDKAKKIWLCPPHLIRVSEHRFRKYVKRTVFA